MKNTIQILLIGLFIGNSLFAQNCFEPDASIWKDTWVSCEKTMNPKAEYGSTHWIRYDFGANRKLSKTWIWNTNDPDRLNQGFNQVKIDYSEDGQDWTYWGEMSFPKAQGEAVYSGFEGPDLQNVTAQYVLVTAISNHGDASCAGIAEIKFNLSPDYEDIQIGDEEGEEGCAVEGAIEYVETFPNAAFLEWSNEGEVDFFIFQFRPLGGDLTTLEIEEPEVYLEYLEPNTTYEYRIGVECGEEEFVFSDILTFTTPPLDPACLPVPSLQLVEVTNSSAVVQWAAPADYDFFILRYGLADEVYEWTEVELEETNRFALEDLEEDDLYGVRVGIICDDIVVWSEQLCFEANEDTDVMTGIKPSEAATVNVTLSPNPTSDRVNLLYNSFDSGHLTYKVLTMAGKVVYQREINIQQGNNPIPINMENLPDGVYYVQGNNGAARFTKKVVKIGR